MATGTPPRFIVEPLDPALAEYAVLENFTGIVKDNDNDPLTVTWDWGDGSVNVTTTGPAGVNTIIRNGHIYTPPIQQGRGTIFEPYKENLTLRIMLYDGNGNFVNCTTLVTVFMPPNGLPVRPSIHINGTNSTRLDPSDVVYVVANTSDPEGESLTWTYVFTNDTDEIYRLVVLNTPATGPGDNVWVNTSHSFATEGLHRIDVYVSDALEPYQLYPHNMTNTIFVNVVVNTAPQCSSVIGIDPSSPLIPSEVGYVDVNLTIDVYDQDGDAVIAVWNFGDGSPGAENLTGGGPSVYRLVQEHRYFEAGLFNITVVITDGRPGHEVTRNLLVAISSTNRPPTLLLMSCASEGPEPFAGEELIFTVVLTDIEQDPLELVWDFGDGSPMVTQFLTTYEGGNVSSTLNHTYTMPGTYSLTLNYTDNEIGIFDHSRQYILALEVTEDDVPPVADAGEDQAADVGDVVYLDGSASSDNRAIVNYSWTFTYNGSEVTLWGPTPTFQFWTTGLYEIVLSVTDEAGNCDTTTVVIVVVDFIPEVGSMMPVAVGMMALLLLVWSRRGRGTQRRSVR